MSLMLVEAFIAGQQFPRAVGAQTRKKLGIPVCRFPVSPAPVRSIDVALWQMDLHQPAELIRSQYVAEPLSCRAEAVRAPTQRKAVARTMPLTVQTVR